MTTTGQKWWQVLGWASLLLLFFAVAKAHACPTDMNCPRGAVCNTSADCVDPGSPQELATTKDQLGLVLPVDFDFSDEQFLEFGDMEAHIEHGSVELQTSTVYHFDGGNVSVGMEIGAQTELLPELEDFSGPSEEIPFWDAITAHPPSF